MENHMSSAAAFVEGGIQDAFEDACSICLEAFCDSDPASVTNCKHEFHLQCILEWCQRSSQCPMCWQDISLKDSTSQDLLEAVVQERNIRSNQSRNATIFHHPTLGDFELQHVPVGGSDSELEERIIQHLAAAAAMGRARHLARREGHRIRSTAHGRPQFLVFSTNPNGPHVGPISAMLGQRGEENEELPTVTHVSTSIAQAGEDSSQQLMQVMPAQVGPIAASPSESSVTRNGIVQISQASEDRPGPSDFQSFSESLKSRFNAVSTRYKESISKSTRGWKERLFSVSRNTSVSDIGSEVRREVNSGIASISRLMEHLEARDNDASASHGIGSSATQLNSERTGNNQVNDLRTMSNASTSCATSSAPN